MSSRQVRGRGELEREVLVCVAAAAKPVSANDVLAELGGGLAYTTVMTTLARLESKGVLGRELHGRSYLYALAGDPADVESSLAAHRMRRVLESREDRAGVLARFVADLSEEDERVLSGLLAGHVNVKPRDRGSA
jgi:predicted transcriptional regulator